jgi:transcription elongation factor GreA
LDAAWSEAVKSPRPADASRYSAAVEMLCERDMAGKALQLTTQMLEALAGKDMLEEAIDIGTRLVRRGAHNEALAKQLVALLEKRFGSEDWFPILRERAGLSPTSITAQAIVEFERLRRYTKGWVVYHQAGWGEGVIDGFDAAKKELTVVFASGRREDFPLDTVIARFKSLDHDDLRAMKLMRMDALRELAAKDPALLIRRTAKLYRGTISSQQLKSELSPSVITDKEWGAFWKRAKTAAAKDPWLRVEGSTTRPVFVVRDRPVGIADEAAQTLSHQNDLGQRISVLRDYLDRGQDEEMKTQILDLASKTVEQAVTEKKSSHAHILDAILFLTEHGRPAPAPPAQELRALLLGADGAMHPKNFEKLATQESRDHAVKLLPEALGEHWADKCITLLPDFPVSVMEQVVDLLVEHKSAERTLDLWDRVAPYPNKHPLLTYLLGRLYSDGTYDQRPDRPDPVTVGRVLLHLGRVLNAQRKGSSLHSRLLGRLVSLLSGKRGFMHRALHGISRDDLANYLGITERGGEDFPLEIVDMVLRVVADRFPDITVKPELPFWEKDEYIFTTKAGLRRIKDEYRHLVEEKIPTNSKAIGAAAALGDLSENSEWESAMEEQRNLTTRATAMDQEVRSARLIEDQEIPDGIVAPGNRITFTEMQTGLQRTVNVLGPWDVLDEHTINYKAPIAHGLLGRRAGDMGEIPTVSGPVPVRIDKVERIA